jgi:hypothetical protein
MRLLKDAQQFVQLCAVMIVGDSSRLDDVAVVGELLHKGRLHRNRLSLNQILVIPLYLDARTFYLGQPTAQYIDGFTADDKITCQKFCYFKKNI